MFVMVGHGEAATRIKYYEENGTELVDKDDPYLFLRYEAADPSSSKRKAESGAPFLQLQSFSAQNSVALLHTEKKLRLFAAAIDSVDESARDDDPEEVAVDPARALEAIVSAERELVVMHDLTKNIENLRTVSVQYVDKALSDQEKLLVTAAAVERRKKDLRAASTRLRAVAKQMRAEVEQDRVFIRSLSELQAFWRIRSTPGRQETQFHAALVCPISVAPARLAAVNDPPPRMPFELLKLQKGLNGAAIVTLAPEHIIPTVQDDALGSAQAHAKATVAVGAHEVHQLLLKRFFEIMWKAVHQRCAWELMQATDALFSRKVVAATLSRMERGADVGDALAQFRPMLWQHMLSQMIPGKGVTASSVLVPNLFVRLKATHLRSKIYQVVSAQVAGYKSAQLMQLPHGKDALLTLLLSAPGQGCMAVTCLLDGRITIHAMPRGSSPVHTCLWLTEYRIHSDSLFVLDDLVVRFWGHAPSP